MSASPDVIAQAAAQAWVKRAADTLSLSKATTLQPKLTTSAISNAPPPHLLPAVAPAAQQLQLPPVKQKTPGTPQPMTLGSQISRWYENAGGLDRAISGAQNAMARRPKPALDDVPGTKGKRDLLWPTWAPEDVTQRTVPVTPVNGNPRSGAVGVWSPNKDGNGPWVGVNARSSDVPATVEHELSHNAYLRNSDVSRAQRRAVWDPDIDGLFERAAKAKKDSELLQIFARPSGKTWRLPERSLIPFSATGPYSDIDYQRYVLDPAEVDVRLAEIKRRYAHEMGKLVETPEQAHDAWEWWRAHQSQWLRSPTHAPTINERTFQLYDELPPDMRQQLFERMPELVRSGQVPSKHAAAAQAWVKQAISPALIAKTLNKHIPRAIAGEIQPARIQRFLGRTQNWLRKYDATGQTIISTPGDRVAKALLQPNAARQAPVLDPKTLPDTPVTNFLRESTPFHAGVPSGALPKQLRRAYARVAAPLPKIDNAPLQIPRIVRQDGFGGAQGAPHVVRGATDFLAHPSIALHELGHSVDFQTPKSLNFAASGLPFMSSEARAWQYGGQINRHLLQNSGLSPDAISAAMKQYYRDARHGMDLYKWESLDDALRNSAGVRPGRVFRDLQRNIQRFNAHVKKSAEQLAPPTLAERFQPDYTPEQLESMGVYDALYRGQGPRLASLGEWKPEWVSEHDPKGWAQWYKRYTAGRRLEGEDERQIKRWLSFKARHGGPFVANPTPRRGWALRNWGIDPAKLVEPGQSAQVQEMLDAYKNRKMQEHLQARASEEKQASNAARRLFTKLMKDTAAGNLRWHGTNTSATKSILDSGTLQGTGDMMFSRHAPFTIYDKGSVLGFTRQSPVFKNRPQDPHYAGKRFFPNTFLSNPAQTAHPAPMAFQADGLKGTMPVQARSGVLRYAADTGDPALNSQLRRHGARIVPRDLMSFMYDRKIPTSTPTTVTAFKFAPQFAHEARSVRALTPRIVTRKDVLRHLANFGAPRSPTSAPVLAAGNNASTFWGDIKRTFSDALSSVSGMFKRSDEKQADLLPEVQLQEHQQRIADRTTSDDPRLLVYHGLGSGKSLSALAAAEAAKKVYGDNYGIVAPASLRGNFQKEIKKFTTSHPEVMSYTGLGMGKKFTEQPETLVMDEAHRLRNPDAASAQAAAQAAAKAKRLLLLTGSPITNNPADLANLLSLLHNKPISPEAFEKRFVGYKKVNPGVLAWLRGVKPGDQPVVQHEGELRKLLAGKVDYQPSKTPEGVNVNEEVVRVPLSPEQKKIQHAIRTKIPPGFLWKLDQEFPLSRDELAKLNSFMTGLRQVSLSTQPFRSDKSPQKAFDQSAKLRTAFENLKTTLDSDPRKKAIIYSNFIDSGLRPYASALEKAQIPHAFFHGGVTPKVRQAAVDAYNAGKLRALLIGPAGAEGLSTKGTSLIQLLDPHWHESRSQQARGRGLRFDSHVGLPEELKNVAVQRYISSSEDPSWMGKLLGYQRERTGDEMLERLTAEKEQLNEAFRKILREEGSPDREKQSAPSGRSAKVLLDAVKRIVTNPALPAAAGGVAGWNANDAFLNQYNPEVTDLGRLRSNLRGATLGAAGGLTLGGHVRRPTATALGLAGTGLALRYGAVTPAQGRLGGLGWGEYFDPGHAKIPKFLAWHDKPENQQKLKDFFNDPSPAVADYAVDKAYEQAKKQFVDPVTQTLSDGNKKTQRAPMQVAVGQHLKEKTLPWLYTETLRALGSDAREKTIKDLKTGKNITVPDVQFSDIGAALAPHLAGGAGGAYLGYRLGDTLGNFIFPDKKTDEYENRRRQEIRRWWLQFLGGNLGAVGGTVAAIKAMPHIQDVMRKQAPQEVKTSAYPSARTISQLLARSLGAKSRNAAGAAGGFLKDRAVDLGYGAALTAGQYGLNSAVPGYIPGAEYDESGKPIRPTTDPWFLGSLTAVNTLAAKPWRRALSPRKTQWPAGLMRRKAGPGNVRPGLLPMLTAGTVLGAGPAVVHPFTHVKKLYETGKALKPFEGDPKTLQNVIGAAFNDPAKALQPALERAKERLEQMHANNVWQGDAVTALGGIAQEAGLPGFDNAGDLANFMKSVSLSTLAQGAGIATGGVGGMLAGDWLADKLLTAAQQRKWLKKRPKTHKFVRDLTALAGAGLGAYGALRGLDVKLPGMVQTGQTPPQTA